VRVALVLMLFLLSLFGGRLVQVQGLDASALATQALRSRTQTQTIFAHRGDIVDSTGDPLATTVELRDVLVDQTLVGQYKRRVGEDRVAVGLPGAAEDLAPLLDVPVATLVKRLTGTNRGATVAKNVAPDVARQVLRLAIPGLATRQASKRIYPAGEVAGNLIGFVNGDGQAQGGLEGAYDKDLAGTPGKLTYESSEEGLQIPTGVLAEVDPRDGCTVHTTIDRDLQYEAQQLLEAQVRTTKAKGAYAVVLDTNFDVRALAVVPTFDPNHYDQATQNQLNDRSLLDTFEPGSTAKVITLAAALQEGVATPASKITVPPFLRKGDTTFHDAEFHGTEHLTLAGVIAQSSNIGTILTGSRMSPQTLYGYQRAFGLGAPTGIGLTESSGILAPWQQWSGSQRSTVMFGQGLSVTALQAADVFATFAADGVRRQPRLVTGESCTDGVFRPAAATASTRVVSPSVAQQMRLMMEQVVGTEGTAAKAAIPGYRVAGKTGTAQVPGKNGYQPGAYVASFIGMAPADAPKLVVAVVLDQPKNGHYGGEVAAPVFSQLMAYALAQAKVPPTGTKTPRMQLQWR
jgi:cell division protein FtsI (penicillin-binding protein 3)